MLDVERYGETLDEIGYSDVLLRFLTDDERSMLEQIVARADRQPPAHRSAQLKQAGRIVYNAHLRADMGHPGFE
jgi:hypothetical protein